MIIIKQYATHLLHFLWSLGEHFIINRNISWFSQICPPLSQYSSKILKVEECHPSWSKADIDVFVVYEGYKSSPIVSTDPPHLPWNSGDNQYMAKNIGLACSADHPISGQKAVCCMWRKYIHWGTWLPDARDLVDEKEGCGNAQGTTYPFLWDLARWSGATWLSAEMLGIRYIWAFVLLFNRQMVCWGWNKSIHNGPGLLWTIYWYSKDTLSLQHHIYAHVTCLGAQLAISTTPKLDA